MHDDRHPPGYASTSNRLGTFDAQLDALTTEFETFRQQFASLSEETILERPDLQQNAIDLLRAVMVATARSRLFFLLSSGQTLPRSGE